MNDFFTNINNKNKGEIILLLISILPYFFNYFFIKDEKLGYIFIFLGFFMFGILKGIYLSLFHYYLKKNNMEIPFYIAKVNGSMKLLLFFLLLLLLIIVGVNIYISVAIFYIAAITWFILLLRESYKD